MDLRLSLSWDDLHGNHKPRHCDKCNHTVTNLSELTAKAARQFLNQLKPGCVRFDGNRDGSVQTVDQLGKHSQLQHVLKLLLAGMINLVVLGCKPPFGAAMGAPKPLSTEGQPTLGIPAGRRLPEKELHDENAVKQPDKPAGASPEDKK